MVESEQFEPDSPILDLLLQFFQALFLRALSGVSGAVAPIDLMLPQHMVNRNGGVIKLLID